MKKCLLKIVLLATLLFCIPYAGFLSEADAATVQLPATGQTGCWDASGVAIACSGTGQDGDNLTGAVWPNPRFIDNSNGTVTDNLTGLIWLKDANCTDTVGGVAKASGYITWPNALVWSNKLASGSCGLTDGSAIGDWRLSNINELGSLIDSQNANPALPSGHLFSNVQTDAYWSSSSCAGNTGNAWFVFLYDGGMYFSGKSDYGYVWPVRGGQ